mgnify:CR=1 FL=1
MENVEGWTIPAAESLVDHGNDFLSANDFNSAALDDIDGKFRLKIIPLLHLLLTDHRGGTRKIRYR